MSTNDFVLLRELISQNKKVVAPELTDSEYFELFTAEQILKDRDLSYEEIEDGIVDGGGDGGIDGVYVFINDSLCREVVETDDYKREVPIELVFIQAKTTFSETAMDKFISSANDLLNLEPDEEVLSRVYNVDLLEKISIFRQCYVQLTSKFPKLAIRYYYAANATEVHQNVERKTAQLNEVVQAAFSPVDFNFEFITASDLLRLARLTPTTVHQLKFVESPISTSQDAYICLVNLGDFNTFITENENLNELIFEGNVRDYQGNTEVNKKIANTLASSQREDFWWLNNGISILCTNASVSGKTLTIENPEIVNGLQTSREIFSALSNRREPTDDRSLLVRVIVTQDEESRDRIIQATNSQTQIPSSSLRATDKIHRDIEEYLGARGLFYDRRKNYYKNHGKPVRKIIGIPALAQAMLACALGEPANARARPSSLIKKNEDYERIFNESYPLDAFYKAAEINRSVEEALRSESSNIPRSHWNNIRFYSSMLASMRLMGTQNPTARKLAEIDLGAVTQEVLQACIKQVWDEYESLGATDQVAKGADLKDKILEKSNL